MIIKLKHRDIVKPQIKIIAETVRVQLEKDTGKKLKLKKMVNYSDEVRFEFKEIENVKD